MCAFYFKKSGFGYSLMELHSLIRRGGAPSGAVAPSLLFYHPYLSATIRKHEVAHTKYVCKKTRLTSFSFKLRQFFSWEEGTPPVHEGTPLSFTRQAPPPVAPTHAPLHTEIRRKDHPNTQNKSGGRVPLPQHDRGYPLPLSKK